MSPPLGVSKLTRWAWSYARRQPLPLAAIGLLTIVTILLNVMRPWPMVFLIDYVLRSEPRPPWLERLLDSLPGTGEAAHLVTWAVAATVLIFLLGWLAGLASRYATVTLGQRITYAVAGDLFRHLHQLSLRFHTSRPVGDSIRRVTSDCGCAAVILREALLPVVSAVGSVAMMFAIMWQINLPLTLLALLVVPCMILVFWLYAGPMLERSYRQEEAEARIYELVERTFTSMPAVQAFSREPLNDALFRRNADNNVAVAVHNLSVQLQFKILIGLVTALGTAGILWLGAREVLAGEMTVGGIVLFLSYLASLYRPIEAVIYTGSTIQSAGGSARRVLDLMAAEREVADRPDAMPLARSRGLVELDRVSFSYDGERPTLDDISLRVESGEAVALVGPTGAGKSTLVSLIPRFFDPTGGRVLIDGRDVREVRLADLRRQVGLVLQEPFLFPLSIAENIAYGRPDARWKRSRRRRAPPSPTASSRSCRRATTR
jgi:ATP-binding cassette, subfamily B, bacterial